MEKALRSLLAAASIPLTLAGCQTTHPTAPYVAPADGNTARLVFRAKTAPGMGYGVYAFDDPHGCTKPLLIGRGSSQAAPASSALRAGRLATLEYVGVDPKRRACQIVLSFYPVRSHTYLVATSQDTSGCVLRVLDATDGENLRGVPVFRRTMQSARCVALGTGNGSADEARHTFGVNQAAAEPSSTTRGLEDLKDLLPDQ